MLLAKISIVVFKPWHANPASPWYKTCPMSCTSLKEQADEYRYLAVKVSGIQSALIKVWDAICHGWLEDLYCPAQQGGQEEALLWSPIQELLLYVNMQDIQVRLVLLQTELCQKLVHRKPGLGQHT